MVSWLPWTSRYQQNRRNHWSTPLVAKNEKSNHQLGDHLQYLSTEQMQDFKEVWTPPRKGSWSVALGSDVHRSHWTIHHLQERTGQKDLIWKCVTMIDPATSWFEIHQYDDKRAITVVNITEEEWSSRYPWPTQVTFCWTEPGGDDRRTCTENENSFNRTAPTWMRMHKRVEREQLHGRAHFSH